MRVYNLAKSEIEKLVQQMDSQLKVKHDKKLRDVKVVEIDQNTRVLVHESFKIAQFDGSLVQFLGDTKNIENIPSVIVDPGAIKFVCNGADIMRPGIVRVEGDFDKGARVVVKESAHGKAIAVGEALFTSTELRNAQKGAVVRNMHYVGDKVWEGFKQATL
ncbi:MAG: RNA-binding protein [Thaumarchaeota archaeon]|nr:RNA-binding protein [Nitrososphaerota archaeon]